MINYKWWCDILYTAWLQSQVIEIGFIFVKKLLAIIIKAVDKNHQPI